MHADWVRHRLPILRRAGRLNGIVLFALGLGVLITPFLPSDAAGIYATIVTLAGTAAAGVTILRKLPRVPEEERRAWRLLGIGILIITAGILAFTVSLATSYAGVFGPHDLGLLAGYAVGMLGVALLPHTRGNSLRRFRLLLDGIIGTIAVSSLAWLFLYKKVASALETAPAWDRAVGSAYPICDTLLVVVVMVVLIRRSTHRFDPRLMLFGLAASLLAAADVAFLLTGAGKSFLDAEPVFSLTLAAVACFLLLGVYLDRPIERREYADRPSTPLWAMVLPYGTAALMITLLVSRVGWSSIGSEDGVLPAATVAIGILVFARQGVAIRENRRYVEEQRTLLVSSISHELRTPLTAMVGFLELLNAGDIDSSDERDEMLAIVTEQATHLTGIVSDLTMLASEHFTSMDLNITALPADELAWSAVNSSTVDTTTVSIESERDLVVFVDRNRINQALVNLLSNAARYGGDRILLTSRSESGSLVLEIHDNGPGVPPKHELVIWEKFERGSNRLNAVVPGSGIGLPVTSAIAKAHGGSAGYRRSERLGGACFWLRLPGRVHKDVRPPKRTAVQPLRRDAQSA